MVKRKALKGFLRPVRLYKDQLRPYFALSCEGVFRISEETDHLSRILDGIAKTLSCDALLVRLDSGITKASMTPWAHMYSFCVEEKGAKKKLFVLDPTRTFLGFNRWDDFLRLIRAARLGFLHDITILYSHDFAQDCSVFFHGRRYVYEFPEREVFESYPLVVLLALERGGFANIVSADNQLCATLARILDIEWHPEVHSYLPEWP